MITDEIFFAWLDGELDSARSAEVEAVVAADPALARKAEAHRALRGRLAASLDPVAAAPVPPRLLAAAVPHDAPVIDLAAARARRRLAYPVWTQWAAMAATLVVGILAGATVNGGSTGPIGREDGRLVASAALEEALYARLASAPAADGPRIGLTFRDSDGDLCRSFNDGAANGLACHEGGDWRIRGLFQAGEGQAAEYRMAAGADPRLAELIDSAMAGEPLDAAGEREALASLR